MTPSPPVLELVGVSKRFGRTVALDNASLVVERGTLHALLGENGAGKTTLMRIVYGLIGPDSGKVLIDGRESRFKRPTDAIAAGIGMVHQHPTTVSAMTVAENIALGRHGLYSPGLVHREVEQLAARVGFAIDPRERVADLSVASQQRLEILKAVARHARLLILDEPTAVLAPGEARDLFTWLRRFAYEGGTAIVITHRLAEARAYTDRITVLRGGRTVFAARSDEADSAAVTEAMVGAAIPASVPRGAAIPADSRVVAQARNLTLRTARGRVAIADASFDVRGGEILGVVGVEGSGHHELLLAVVGRHDVATGELLRPTRTSFVPEDRHRDAVVLDFSLTENVAINGAGDRRGRMNWPALNAATQALLARYDVRARGPDDVISALSGGNQQKVVLARELEANPELLVVENPTRGLDIRAAAFVRKQIEAARDAGVAVIFYSSDLDEVIEIADRILAVCSGAVRAVSRDRAVVAAAMLGAS